LKYTKSKDGEHRANMHITLRFTKEELQELKECFEVKTILSLRATFKNMIYAEIEEQKVNYSLRNEV
jgi:hypothetical protein